MFSGGVAQGSREQIAEVRHGLAKAVHQRLLKLAVRINVDGVAGAGQRREGVFAEIKARHVGRFFGSPMAGAHVAVFPFVQLYAGSSQTKLARPMKRQVVGGEFRSVTQMRIPTLTGADKQHPVASIANDVSVIAKGEFEFSA